jgi:catechol 2,3-dioxygenase-like lactoylglutathione lyase family enzyme
MMAAPGLGEMPVMKLNAIGIVCADIEQSLRFYRRLGVELSEFNPEEGHYEATVAAGFRLMLDSHDVMRQVVDDFVPPTRNEVVGLAVECESPAEVDSTYHQLVALGVESVREPWNAFWGQRYASVKDPDGNQVDLYAAN